MINLETPSDAYTFYFNEIFPNIEVFKEFIAVNNLGNYVTGINKTLDLTENFIVYAYNILTRHFTHQNIRYSTVDAFLCEFANVLEDKMFQFKKQLDMIIKLYDYNEKDYSKIQEVINNLANNPNDEPADPKQPIEFISSQTYNIAHGNPYEPFFRALNDLPSLRINNFINGTLQEKKKGDIQFTDLFMNVQPNQIYVYEKEYKK